MAHYLTQYLRRTLQAHPTRVATISGTRQHS